MRVFVWHCTQRPSRPGRSEGNDQGSGIARSGFDATRFKNEVVFKGEDGSRWTGALVDDLGDLDDLARGRSSNEWRGRGMKKGHGHEGGEQRAEWGKGKGKEKEKKQQGDTNTHETSEEKRNRGKEGKPKNGKRRSEEEAGCWVMMCSIILRSDSGSRESRAE